MAGWQVLGRLPATPYDDPHDAPSFLDITEVLGDDRLDAVALDRSLADHLPRLREAGLAVLLPEPWALPAEVLRQAAAMSAGPQVAVALRSRWQAWTQAVTAAAPLGGTPAQLTVRGWPRGEQAAAELVDLATTWCGEVLITFADRTVPAPAMPDGPVITWSLLTDSGATVLVSHQGGLGIRLTLAGGRIEAEPSSVRWQAGACLPMPTAPDPLVATAQALRSGICRDQVDPHQVDPRHVPPPSWPCPGTLADLLRISNVLAALRRSASTGAPVRVS